MLDDLKIIAERDNQDALGFAGKQPQQLKKNFNVSLSTPHAFTNVVFAGMGGSALYAGMVKSWPGVSVPFEIVRSYNIPGYVNENTLFIASSFSGNTEETLSCLEEAEATGAAITVIAAGGKLVEVANQKGYPLVLLDHSIPQPRMAALEGYKALISLLDAAGVCNQDVSELVAAAPLLETAAESWRADVPVSQNKAKQIALELVGRSVVVYSGPFLAPVDYKWKISFNENAKTIAWSNQYPEFNHNEFIGWTSHPTEKPYAIVNLHSNFEHPRVLKRFEISDRLLSGKRPQPITVAVEGETRLEQMLWATLLGDFVSIYLAILNNVNPVPVALVEKLKEEMSKEGEA